MAQYTIQELSTVTGISVRSLRNYLRQYEEHLNPARGACNALLFGEGDVESFVKIRTYLREGKSREEIKALLAGEASDGALVLTRTDGPPTSETAPVPAELGELLEGMEVQTALLRELLTENGRLRERMEVLEVRLALREGEPGSVPALPGPHPPRTVPVRSRRIEIPLPYFVLRLKDGATAAVRAVVDTVRTRVRRPPAP